jgi:hypothetical protein
MCSQKINDANYVWSEDQRCKFAGITGTRRMLRYAPRFHRKKSKKIPKKKCQKKSSKKKVSKKFPKKFPKLKNFYA